jgi:hypothetical protein
MRLNEVENRKPIKLDISNIKLDQKVITKIRDLTFEKKQIYEDLYFSDLDLSPEAKEQLATRFQDIKKQIAELKNQQFNKDDIQAESKALLQIINTKCSKYVDIFNNCNELLYRGMSVSSPAFESESIEGRNPRDSDMFSTILYDESLKKLGIKALRTNSIFTTSRYEVAKGYAPQVNVIFPENSACYSWSETKDDLVLRPDTFEDMMKFKQQTLKALKDEQVTVQHFYDQITGDEDDIYDKKYNLKIYSNYLTNVYNEQNIFLGEHRRAFLTAKFPNALLLKLTVDDYEGVNIEKFRKKYHPSQTDLEVALIKKHEVLIHGKYIAVNYDLWKQIK